MVFTLGDFAQIGLTMISYVGVLWLIISSLISCCCAAKPSTPRRAVEPVASSFPEPMKVDNVITDVESAGRPAAEPLVAVAEPSLATVAPAAKLAKPRMYFLDNLKAFLTVVVICHHTIDAFQGSTSTGVGFCIADPETLAMPPKTVYALFASVVLTLNQSYFMALFFFISGYFTPSSLDRKGVSGFLRDRFKRIGIPAVIYNSGLGPFQIWLIMFLGKNVPDIDFPHVGYLNKTYEYMSYPGQCWYLFWLVLLSFIYAFVHKHMVNVPSPQLGHVFLFAFGVGIWFVLVPWDGSPSFAMVPGGIHSFFYYVLYFSAGVLAKRNDWMVEITKWQNKGYNSKTFFLLGMMAFLTICVAVYKYSTGDSFNAAEVKEAEQSSGMYNFCLGFFAVVISLAELLLFNVYFNKGGRVSKFFCESAYGAYILHFLFLELGIHIYFIWMRQFSQIPEDNFVYWQAMLPYGGTSHIVWTNVNGVTVGEGWIWLGMLFVCVFATTCSFSAAFLLRKLPLFNQVL